MSYKIYNYTQDGRSYDIMQLVTSIKWGGDIKQAARHLEINLAFGPDQSLPQYSVPIGSLLILYNDAKEIIRGVVFEAQKNTSGYYSVQTYDHLNYLLKSQGTYIFRSMTATAIIAKLCGDFGIPIGSIPDTGVALNKLILRDMAIYDMCIIALTETTKRNGKKYMLRMIEGKLNAIERGQEVARWVISEGVNLTSATLNVNINEMKNKIIVLGDKDQIIATVSDSTLIGQFGILQEIKRESDIKIGDAQTIATNALKDLAKVSQESTIECLGNDDVTAGTAITVTESLTGLSGTYYVGTDEHTLENFQHTMRLKLNWTDEVDTKDAPEVDE